MFNWLTRLFKDPSPKADCLKIIKAIHKAVLPIRNTADIVGLKLHARFTPSAISVESPRHWIIRIRLSLDRDPKNSVLFIQAVKYDGQMGYDGRTWSYSVSVFGSALRDTSSLSAHDWDLLYKVFVQMGLDTPRITIERPDAIGSEAEALLQHLAGQSAQAAPLPNRTPNCKVILQSLYTMAKYDYNGLPLSELVSAGGDVCCMQFVPVKDSDLIILRLESVGTGPVSALTVSCGPDGLVRAILGLTCEGMWQDAPTLTDEEWQTVYRILSELDLTDHRDAAGRYVFKFHRFGGTYV